MIRDDPSDDLVLETALLGDALVIVTGDHHLLTFGTFGDINIVPATELLPALTYQSHVPAHPVAIVLGKVK